MVAKAPQFAGPFQSATRHTAKLGSEGVSPDTESDRTGDAEWLTSAQPQEPEPRAAWLMPVTRLLQDCEDRAAIVNGSEGQTITEQLRDLVRAKRTRVLSYDIFDTLLLRDDKPEALRYLEMGGRMLHDVTAALGNHATSGLTPHDFLFARVHGMKASYRLRRRVRGCGEGRIEDVAAVTCQMLGLPEEAVPVLLESEIFYEVDNLRLNMVLFEFALEFRALGGRVILLSDMYLGASQLEKIVRASSPEGPLPFDEILSSADLVINKRSGLVFSELEKRFNTPASAFLHIGDSALGDVRQARRAGWTALHFPVSTAERARRESALRRFISEMDIQGYNVRDWAKL